MVGVWLGKQRATTCSQRANDFNVLKRAIQIYDQSERSTIII